MFGIFGGSEKTVAAQNDAITSFNGALDATKISIIRRIARQLFAA